MKQKLIQYGNISVFLILLVSVHISVLMAMDRPQIAGPSGVPSHSFRSTGPVGRPGSSSQGRPNLPLVSDSFQNEALSLSRNVSDHNVSKFFVSKPDKDDFPLIYFGYRTAMASYILDSAATLSDLRHAYERMEAAGVDIRYQMPGVFKITADDFVAKTIHETADQLLDKAAGFSGFSRDFQSAQPETYDRVIRELNKQLDSELKKRLGSEFKPKDILEVSDPKLVSALIHFEPFIYNKNLSIDEIKSYFNEALSLFEKAETREQKAFFGNIVNFCFFDKLLVTSTLQFVSAYTNLQLNQCSELNLYKKTGGYWIPLLKKLDDLKDPISRETVVQLLKQSYAELQSDSAIYADLERVYPEIVSNFQKEFSESSTLLKRRGQFVLLGTAVDSELRKEYKFTFGEKAVTSFPKEKLQQLIELGSNQQKCSYQEYIISNKKLQDSIRLHWVTAILGKEYVESVAKQCSGDVVDPASVLLNALTKIKQVPSLTAPITPEEVAKMQKEEDALRLKPGAKKKKPAKKQGRMYSFNILKGNCPEEDPVVSLPDTINRAPIQATPTGADFSGSSAPKYCSAQDGWQVVAPIPNPKALSGYAHRVHKWFDPEFRAARDESSLRYHTAVPLLADKYAIAYGKAIRRPNATHPGQMDTQYRLYGQRIEPDGTASYIEINCTLDPNGICYHRDSKEISDPSDALLKRAKPLEWISTEGLLMGPDDLAPVAVESLNPKRLLQGEIISQDELHVRIQDPYNGGEVILFLPMRGKK